MFGLCVCVCVCACVTVNLYNFQVMCIISQLVIDVLPEYFS